MRQKKTESTMGFWLAMDRTTRDMVGLQVGAREALAAQALWDSLPIEYRHHAHGYTDFWSAYCDIFPEAQHTYLWQRVRPNQPY